MYFRVWRLIYLTCTGIRKNCTHPQFPPISFHRVWPIAALTRFLKERHYTVCRWCHRIQSHNSLQNHRGTPIFWSDSLLVAKIITNRTEINRACTLGHLLFPNCFIGWRVLSCFAILLNIKMLFKNTLFLITQNIEAKCIWSASFCQAG